MPQQNECNHERCKKPKKDDMVQCDSCKEWYHFVCVGVTKEIEKVSWNCENCSQKEDNRSQSEQSKSSITTKDTRARLEIQKLEEEKKAMEKIAKEYLDKKYEILSQASGRSNARTLDVQIEDTDVQDWVNNINTNTTKENNIEVIGAGALAARQIVSKELPIFHGSAEEWPLFIAQFEETTKLCKYSNAENLIRLQKCLKGKALEAVRYQLLQPVNVPNIIDVLKTLFGKPEIIINNLIKKIRSDPPPKLEKMDTLMTFALSVKNLCATMEATALEFHLNNPILLQELTDKLPSHLKLNWALHKAKLGIANITTFASWIYNIAMAAYDVSSPSGEDKDQHKSKERGHIHTHMGNEDRTKMLQYSCRLCKHDCSNVSKCPKFINMERNSRWNVIKEFNLCRLCLGGHRGKCRSNIKCTKNGCIYNHHPMLHKDEPQNNVKGNDGALVSTHGESNKKVLFRILPVTLYNGSIIMNTFAFVDEGSSVTLIQEDLANKLNLKGPTSQLCLTWTDNTQRIEENSRRVSFEISGGELSRHYNVINVRTVSQLNLPNQTLSEDLKKKYHHLKNLPLPTYPSIKPTLLIGLDNWKIGVPLKVKEGGMDEPVAVKSRLGWSVYGPYEVPESQNQNFQGLHLCQCEQLDITMHQKMKNYFKLDSIGIVRSEKALDSKDIERANEILQSTTCMKENRYEVGLLWKVPNLSLPDNYDTARKRLECLEKRLKREPKLRENIDDQMKQYIEKGYIRKLSVSEIAANHNRKWYLPIFPVINIKKPGKVRIVWDAAATFQGISLNSCLLKGPDQLSSLWEILLRFREKEIAVSGDIREMFHQILVREKDRQSQRFLWRENDKKEPDIYIMNVLTFGASCSPSIAQHIKNLNADQFAHTYPRATQAIKENHYVDDWLQSIDTEEEAMQLVREVKYVHSQAGFEMRNWISNSKKINDLNIEKKNGNKIFDEDSVMEKVLGMWWCTSADTFTFSLKYQENNEEILRGKKIPTKREMLKILMSIFDPLGLLANYLVNLKILIQEVWRTGIDWDDKLPNELVEKWQSWRSELPLVENINIARQYFNHEGKDEIYDEAELHTFVDASEQAFSAVAYVRIRLQNKFKCALIATKTRVAPLKYVSIPRLELEAAVLGSRLSNSIMKAHTIKFNKRYFWTDSKTVLSWLNSDHRKYKQFVGFRVGEILEDTDLNEWNWVPTALNVADEASKWQKTSAFKSSRWFEGPSFLLQSEEYWPTTRISETLEEPRTHSTNHVRISENLIDIRRFSSWAKLRKAVAFVFRFIHNMLVKTKGTRLKSGPLQTSELSAADNRLYFLAQQELYPEESDILKYNKGKAIKELKKLPKRSSIYKLTPYMDEDNIIRAHLRIDSAVETKETTRRPIILGRNHYITYLILCHYHQSYHHRHHETVLNELKQIYCISRLRVALKSIRSKCQVCKIKDACPLMPRMADLPAARLATFTRPFSYVGIDYFGPLYVSNGRRQEKRWGVVITCLTTRAVHIEVAHSLSTDSCIICIRKFMARRGVPIEIYSDNGTNFHGAETELSKARKYIDENQMAAELNSPHTEWKFNPPCAPHMGGIWERLVRSIKNVLAGIKLHTNPNDETLQGMMAEVENILNSRPLTYLSLDHHTEEALTPNHFLLGSSNGLKPLGPINDESKVVRKCWEKSEQFANKFWRRWVSEYLPEITRRSKWYNFNRPIKEGDIVIIVNEDQPRNHWPKGRVLQVTTSKDGQVRRAVVKTISGIYERPAVKLAVLDVAADRNE